MLGLAAGLALLLVGLAALPFVARRLGRGAPETDPAAAARGRRVRGGILIGIALLWYPVGALIQRAEARDGEEADRRADELAAAVILLADADRPRFILAAMSLDAGNRLRLVEDLHLRSATGDAATTATTRHQVEVGRATRCVIVTVQRDAPPTHRVVDRRC